MNQIRINEERDQVIFRRRRDGEKLHVIAQDFNLTTERVRQIHFNVRKKRLESIGVGWSISARASAFLQKAEG